MWKLHPVRTMNLFCMFQADCKIILYHTQNHRTVFRTLTFHMISFLTNDYVRICYLLSTLRQMLIPPLYNFHIRWIIRSEHLINQWYCKLWHFLCFRPKNIIKYRALCHEIPPFSLFGYLMYFSFCLSDVY